MFNSTIYSNSNSSKPMIRVYPSSCVECNLFSECDRKYNMKHSAPRHLYTGMGEGNYGIRLNYEGEVICLPHLH